MWYAGLRSAQHARLGFRRLWGAASPGHPSSIEKRRRVARKGSAQGAQQRLRLFQIGRVKALGERAVDWCKQIARFGTVPPIAQKPGEARGSAQFPELRI